MTETFARPFTSNSPVAERITSVFFRDGLQDKTSSADCILRSVTVFSFVCIDVENCPLMHFLLMFAVVLNMIWWMVMAAAVGVGVYTLNMF